MTVCDLGDSVGRENVILSALQRWGEGGMAVKITRTDHTAEALRREAARASEPDAARRMLAIAMVLEGVPREQAARLCGMDRQTLRDWVHRYNAEGLAGLSNRRRPGRQPRLSPEQEAEFVIIVTKGPDPAEHGVVRWRRVDLQAILAEQFGVHMHVRSVGKLLRRLGFSHLSARPRHPKSDAEAQEAFKKTLAIA